MQIVHVVVKTPCLCCHTGKSKAIALRWLFFLPCGQRQVYANLCTIIVEHDGKALLQ